jgi:DNA gyrase inhibitor GyrI
MNNLTVRIVKLEPMRVATALGFGPSPEPLAWDKIINFMKANDLLDDLESLRFFGFNNPNPSPGSPNYGYEQWVTVGPEVDAGDDIKIINFPGGTYAVARCEGLADIGNIWKQLVAWHEDSPYEKSPNYYQCLEEVLNPAVFITPDGESVEDEESYDAVIFDLYLPVAE